MTRAAWPSAFGRGRAGPLQVDVPQRLPGGIWGPPPIAGTVSWDANGFPIDPATGAPAVGGVLVSSLADTTQSLLQAEWPLPTRWELQVGLGLTCIKGGPAQWSAPTGTFNVRGVLESRVESAMVSQVIDLAFGPGVYPLTAAQAGILGLSNTFPVIGQVVRVRLTDVVLGSDAILADQTWSWNVNVLCGLLSAGWPG